MANGVPSGPPPGPSRRDDAAEPRVLSEKGKARLLDERLHSCGLQRQPVEGDGNCLYRALALPLKLDWVAVKEDIFRTMQRDPKYRQHFEAEVLCDFPSFDDYVRTKSRGKGSLAWGGTPEILVFCDVYKHSVSVYTYNSTVTLHGTAFLSDAPLSPRKQVCIAHVGGNHYDAVLFGSSKTPIPQAPECFTRELHVLEEDSDAEIVRTVDLYEDACVYDIVQVLHIHTPSPFQLYVAPYAPGQQSTYVLLDEEAFDVVVKANPRVSVLVKAWAVSDRESIVVTRWVDHRQPPAAVVPEPPQPLASPPAADPPVYAATMRVAPTAGPGPVAEVPHSNSAPPSARTVGSPNPSSSTLLSGKTPSPAPSSVLAYEYPPGIEPKGMVAFEGAVGEPLLLEASVTNLRATLRWGADQGLALFLTPTKVFATGPDGALVVAWDIADCVVEQSVRKALDKRYFNIANREKDAKLHLYCTDRATAALIKAVVDFYSEQRTRRARLLTSLGIRPPAGPRR